jgi:hypothetical protein
MIEDFNYFRQEDSIDIPKKKWTNNQKFNINLPEDSGCGGMPYFEAKSFVSDDFHNDFEPSLFSRQNKRPKHEFAP